MNLPHHKAKTKYKTKANKATQREQGRHQHSHKRYTSLTQISTSAQTNPPVCCREQNFSKAQKYINTRTSIEDSQSPSRPNPPMYHRENNNHSNHGISQKTKTKRVEGGGANTRAGAMAVAVVRALYTF